MSIAQPGFGLGLRSDHYAWILQEQPQLDWFEAVSENFIHSGGKPRRVLEQIRSRYPVALHGVGLSIASIERPQDKYLTGLRRLADDIEPHIVSDHLCWTRHGGRNSHDLLPVAYNEDVLAHVTGRVHEVQERLGRRLFLENASAYIAFAQSDMDEADFLAALCRATGCGLLLDVNNLYVNAMNLGVDAHAYLNKIAPEWVGYMHLAGHTVLPNIRVDTHDAPVTDSVWQLYRQAVQRFPDVSTLLEWDGQVPSFSELRAELGKAETAHAEALAALAKASQLANYTPAQACKKTSSKSQPPWAELAQSFWQMATGQSSVSEDDPALAILAPTVPAPAVVGINVYADAYFLRLEEALTNTYPTLAYALGKADFRSLCQAYLEAHPSTEASIKFAGSALPEYLQRTNLPGVDDFPVPQQVLADIAAFEWATSDLIDAPDDATALAESALAEIAPEEWEHVRFRFTHGWRLIPMTYAVGPIVEAVAQGEAPTRPAAGSYLYLFYRQDEAVAFMELNEPEVACFTKLVAGATFSEACHAAATSAEDDDEERVVMAMVVSLGKWLRAELITGIERQR